MVTVFTVITLKLEKSNFIDMNDNQTLRMMVMASLFAALIAVGALVAVPIGPVPIYLANFFVMLAALVLGPRWGLAAVGTYLLAGALGLPVFSGGSGGIGRFWGPTGGYLLAYLPGVYLGGLVSNRIRPSVRMDIIALLLTTAIIYALGVPWLKVITQMSWQKSVALGMLPFLIGDGIKMAAAISVARMVRPLVGMGDGVSSSVPIV